MSQRTSPCLVSIANTVFHPVCALALLGGSYTPDGDVFAFTPP